MKKILLFTILLLVGWAVMVVASKQLQPPLLGASPPPEATNEPIRETALDTEQVEEADSRGEATAVKQSGWATASWYGLESCTNPLCHMANGQPFNPSAFTTACDSRWPLGTRFVFRYAGKKAEAVCTDRGRFAKYGRLFDFSRGLFEYFAPLSQGVIKVWYEEVE